MADYTHTFVAMAGMSDCRFMACTTDEMHLTRCGISEESPAAGFQGDPCPQWLESADHRCTYDIAERCKQPVTEVVVSALHGNWPVCAEHARHVRQCAECSARTLELIPA